MNAMPTLISFGEILWDIIDGHAYLGGAPFNLTAHAAQLGMNARLISRVGDDELGHTALADAQRLGVDVSGVMSGGGYATGKVDVSLSNGQPSYTIQYPAAWDFIEVPQELDSSPLPAADVICFGTLAQRSPVSQSSLKHLLEALPETPAFFDVNLRQDFYTKEILEWGLRHAQIVKMNDTEAVFLAQMFFGQEMTERQFAATLQSVYEVDVVLITLGAKGCLAAEGEEITLVPSPEIVVKDTVGAGDAFSAAFLSAWLRCGSAAKAAAFGNILGGYVAAQSGAVPKYSDLIREQIKSFDDC